jgi:hypothetical protein
MALGNPRLAPEVRGAGALLRGAPEKKKMKATYIWQMINQVGRYFFSFFFFVAFLCVSHQGEFKNTTKNFLAEKVEKKNVFPSIFSHRFF